MSASTDNTVDFDRAGWPPAVWLMLLLLAWLVIGLAAAVQTATLDLVAWPGAVRLPLLEWGPWLVLAPAVLWFARRVQIGPRTWRWAVPAHLVACLLTVLLLEEVAAWAFQQEWMRPPLPPDRGRMPDRFFFPQPREGPGPRREGFGPPFGRRFMRSRVSLPLYWLFVAAAHLVSYHRRGVERERRALHAEARLTEARLAALQSQLNPHFLFNALNTITHYINTNPRAAEEMIASLSTLLRSVLAAADRREVSLAEELRFIDHYLDIQRWRFTDRLTVCREIAPEALTAAVPTLLLQPLVENAVVHGIAPERTPGTVTLRARVEAQRLVIEIVDTGRSGGGSAAPGTPLRFTEGVGLTNTRARLQVLYGKTCEFSLTGAAGGGVCARLVLPRRTLSVS